MAQYRYTAFGTYERLAEPTIARRFSTEHFVDAPRLESEDFIATCPSGSAMSGSKCASCASGYLYEDSKCKKIIAVAKGKACPVNSSMNNTVGGCVSSKETTTPKLDAPTTCDCPPQFVFDKNSKGDNICVQQCSVNGPGDWKYTQDRNYCVKNESVTRDNVAPVGRKCPRGYELNGETGRCLKACDPGWDAKGQACIKTTEKQMAPITNPTCSSLTAAKR